MPLTFFYPASPFILHGCILFIWPKVLKIIKLKSSKNIFLKVFFFCKSYHHTDFALYVCSLNLGSLFLNVTPALTFQRCHFLYEKGGGVPVCQSVWRRDRETVSRWLLRFFHCLFYQLLHVYTSLNPHAHADNVLRVR